MSFVLVSWHIQKTRIRPVSGCTRQVQWFRHQIIEKQSIELNSKHISHGGGQKTVTTKLRTHLVTFLLAVMLATMTLSGLGVATALKVPFQNFSKSCFSSS